MTDFINISTFYYISYTLNYSIFSRSQCILHVHVKQVLHPFTSPKKNLKHAGVVNHVFDRRGSQFYDFNEQILPRQFPWQKFIEIYQIFKVMMLCANWLSQGVKGYTIQVDSYTWVFTVLLLLLKKYTIFLASYFDPLLFNFGYRLRVLAT